MTPVHRADCEDCSWSHESDDIIEATDAMERHQRKEHHDVDFQRAVATDGGSKYVNETGEGYLGIVKLCGYTLNIPIGAWDGFDWRSGDDLWLVDDDPGLGIVDEKPSDPIGKARAFKYNVGPGVHIPAKHIRQTLDIPPKVDVRIYRRGEDGMRVVPAEPDPMLATDGGLLPADWGAVDAEPPRNFPERVTPRDLHEAVLEHDTLLAVTREVRSGRELVRTALARFDLLEQVATPDARKGETLLPDGGRRSIGELTGVSPIDVEGRAVLGIQGSDETVGVHVPQDKVKPLLKSVRELALIYAARGSDDDLATDGGQVDETHRCDICDTEFGTIARLIRHDCDDYRNQAVATDGGVDGAVDHDYDEHRKAFEDDVIDELASVRTSPMPGGVALDLVTRQPLFVRQKLYDDLVEHYESEGYNLLTYKTHPYLPVRKDDSVFECVFIGTNPESAHNPGDTYDFPEGRLMHVPVEQAWDGGDE